MCSKMPWMSCERTCMLVGVVYASRCSNATIWQENRTSYDDLARNFGISESAVTNYLASARRVSGNSCWSGGACPRRATRSSGARHARCSGDLRPRAVAIEKGRRTAGLERHALSAHRGDRPRRVRASSTRPKIPNWRCKSRYKGFGRSRRSARSGQPGAPWDRAGS